MTSAGPPRLATWILLYLMPGEHNEALAGDLFESVRAGRSSVWYWRQVLNAVIIRWLGSLFRHWPALVFATAWATLSPAWNLLIIRLYNTNNLIGPVWRLPWPWSTVCASGLSLAETLLFVWTGVLIYLLLLSGALRTKLNWQIGRALAASLAGCVLAFLCQMTIGLIFVRVTSGHGVDWRTLTLSGVITNLKFPAILMRLPYVIATFFALWGAVPIVEGSVKLVD
jgi:hypothetical protein